jgi:hypothetical protein
MKEHQRLQDAKAEDNGEGLNVSRGRSEKKGSKDKKSRSKSKEGEKTKYKCFICHKQGYFKKDCLAKGKGNKGPNYTIDTTDLVVEADGYKSAGVLVVSTSRNDKEWVMDSGCSYHMCPNKDYFESLELKHGGLVLLGDDQPCIVQGIGTVRLRMYNNQDFLLKQVRYVSELRRNLISLSALDDLRLKSNTENGVMKIINGSLVIAKGYKRNGIFFLDGSTATAHASVVCEKQLDKAKLWHQRLGHVSEKGLIELEKQNLLNGDKLNKLEFCDQCVLGKSHRVSFGCGMHVSTRPFEYVHSDLWGPSKVKTLGGGSYFLTMIDDYSRRVWIYILKKQVRNISKVQGMAHSHRESTRV